MAVVLTTSENAHTFLPENARIPGQHGLQQHGRISLGFIATQVVFQLSGKHTGEEFCQATRMREPRRLGGKKLKDVLNCRISCARCGANFQTVHVLLGMNARGELTCALWRPG